VVPFGLFAPQPVASIAAGVIVITQLWLVASGNFAWLNWLTIFLAFSAVDQRWVGVGASGVLPGPPLWFVILVIGVTAAMLVLSYWPVRNMLSPAQRMNMSFNVFHLCNTYGAFGSISRIRQEVVIEGTSDTSVGDQTVWQEYEFKGKPTGLRRLPRQFAPYHLRLDWLMWFAAISPGYALAWMTPLLHRLLRNDFATLKLLQRNPFPDSPSRFVRAQLYKYRFTTPAELRRDRAWWHRTLIGSYVPPLALPAQSGGSPTQDQ
jgi:hypothetical protein